jgi:hypothetical protein
LAAHVIVDGADMALIRPRQDMAALWEKDIVPSWIAHD